MIRVMLPQHLRTLAQAGRVVDLQVEGPVTQRAVLDALEEAYPGLRGTIRDQNTKQRRPLVRFFACQQDLSHESPDAPLPDAVASGKEPFLVIGAMAGGSGQERGGEALKYMLLIYQDEQVLSDSMREACYVESAALARDLNASGQYLGASPLHSVATAASVRMRNGKRLVTDGPFAETREQLGGYYLVEAKDRAEAIEIAGRIPGAKFGTVEVRPILEIAGLPDD